MLLAAVLLLGLATGCQEGPPAATPSADPWASITPAPVSSVPTLDTTLGLRFPTHAYRPTPAQADVIAKATALELARCMASYGLTWRVPAWGIEESEATARLYGVSDLATAETYGYHLPPAATPDTVTMSRSPSEAELLVLTGESAGTGPATYAGRPVPDGGCANQARVSATGFESIDDERLADTISIAMWRRSQSDDRVVAVLRDWSACMRDSGYTYASPLDPAVDNPEWLQAATAGPTEIATAVADAQCKLRTNLIGEWYAVESAYETTAIQQHLAALTSVKHRWDAATLRAQQVLATAALSG